MTRAIYQRNLSSFEALILFILMLFLLLGFPKPAFSAGLLDLGGDVDIVGDTGLRFKGLSYDGQAYDVTINLNPDLSWHLVSGDVPAGTDSFHLRNASAFVFDSDVVQINNVFFKSRGYSARIRINIDGTWTPFDAEFTSEGHIRVPADFAYDMSKNVAANISVVSVDGGAMKNVNVSVYIPAYIAVDFSGEDDSSDLVLADHSQDKLLVSGQTDASGMFTQTIRVPGYARVLRISASNIGVANNLVDMVITDGKISLSIDGSHNDDAYYVANNSQVRPANRREGPSVKWNYLLDVDENGNRVIGSFDTDVFDSQGVIKTRYVANPPVITRELLNNISTALVERRVNPEFLTDDEGGNLLLTTEAEVTIAFLHEGAGYKNTVGYFTYPNGQVPTSRDEIEPVVIFPNASYQRSGGSALGLNTGDTITLGKFPAGTRIGFFIVANGWRNEYKGPDHSWVFHTVAGLNSEPVPTEGEDDLRLHTVLLDAGGNTGLVLGMEDILRTTGYCDHDFNDGVFLINAEPASAIDRRGLKLLVPPEDTDEDGVLNKNDHYPDDPSRAFDSQTTGTLAYEDLWPSEGDYDMNDLVLSYTIDEVLDADNKIKEITASYEIKARGAALENGFALALGDLISETGHTAMISRNGGDAVPLNAEAGQTNLVFNLLGNAHPETVITQGDECEFFNTEPACKPAAQGGSFSLNVVFDDAQERATLTDAPYNPFLYRSEDRGIEVHLPNHQPTDLANMDLFGTADDNSDAETGRYYKTTKGLPWALNLPVAWHYPAETIGITDVYLQFFTWVQSNGVDASDWYLNPADADLLY